MCKVDVSYKPVAFRCGGRFSLAWLQSPRRYAPERPFAHAILRRSRRLRSNQLVNPIQMTAKEGKRQNKSNPLPCASCPLLAPCTTSKDHRKIIERHIQAHHKEEADHLRHQSDMNKSMHVEKKRLNVYLQMRKKSMIYVGQHYEGYKNCSCKRWAKSNNGRK
ncbi:transposase [Lysinibacillus sphaericus OT4b.31]|uniref:Transposase n=1 Tax=Lysinibacillus sphaericus OT4b.31 TaxID=1285586 RepID=R7ZF34_LYSSH|nr:transposase [Lysinibacillus sphaericus OT4b.31]